MTAVGGVHVQVRLCNIAHTPITHYTVNCANCTVQVILCSFIDRVYPGHQQQIPFQQQQQQQQHLANEQVYSYDHLLKLEKLA